jgi:hypothetical protein
LLERWISALRSDTYKQGRYHLKHKGRHCCLGVLCEVLELDWKQEEMFNELPPERIFPKTGLGLDASKVDEDFDYQNVAQVLVIFNDIRELSFREIADWIESRMLPLAGDLKNES